MGLTPANAHKQIPAAALGGLRTRVVMATFDNSYATGGESLVPHDVGLAQILFVGISGDANAQGGVDVRYDYTARKLVAFRTGTHTHVENTAASYTQNATTNANVQASLAEVTAAVDLSALVVRLFIVGI